MSLPYSSYMSPMDAAIQHMEDCNEYAVKYGYRIREPIDDKSPKPTPTADSAAAVNKDDSKEPKTPNGKDDDAKACMCLVPNCSKKITIDEMLIDPVANMYKYLNTHQHQVEATISSIKKAFDSGLFDEVPSRSNRKKSGYVRRGGKNSRH